MSRSMYWWSNYGVPRSSRSNRVPRYVKQSIRDAEGTFPAPLEPLSPPPLEWSDMTPDFGGDPMPQVECGFLHFIRSYWKNLLVCLFWTAASLWILIGYGTDFAYLGIACLLYYGLLLMGLVVTIGLPIKWYRDYRRADGIAI
jgi:hypothetical protein